LWVALAWPATEVLRSPDAPAFGLRRSGGTTFGDDGAAMAPAHSEGSLVCLFAKPVVMGFGVAAMGPLTAHGEIEQGAGQSL